MNLKEAFRYQNKLQSFLEEAQEILSRDSNVTKVENTYLRHKVMAEAEDETVVVTPDTEYYEQITGIAQFLLYLLGEKETLFAAIRMAKDALDIDMDSEVSLNATRQSIARTFQRMNDLRSSEQTISNGGAGYRFNAEGNQISYRCDVKRLTTISSICEHQLTAAIINNGAAGIDRQRARFLEALGIALESVSLQEVTFHTVCSLLQEADRNSYINDSDEVLEQLALDKLVGRYGREIDYGENLTVAASRKRIYGRAEQLLMKEALLPELDRIYAGRAQGRMTGHPVHYMVQTDDAGTRREVCRMLLQALYAQRRLQNRRYCFADFRPGEHISATVYDQFYRSNAGGAVIVRFSANDDSEDDHADCGRETIEVLCETMKKYRNSVLTIFCLPRECSRTKAGFYEDLGSASIIELQETLVSGERAEQYLKMLAKDAGICTDKALLERLEDGKGYLAPELRGLFDEWYDRKLKTSVFPQYRDIAAVNRTVIKAAPKGSAYEELNRMIGLDEAKKGHPSGAGLF